MHLPSASHPITNLRRIILRVSDSILAVPRLPFRIDDPWALPPAVPPIELVRVTDGSSPRLATSVCVYRDDLHLNLLYRAHDDEVVASYLEHDQPLWEEDVVEVFLAPDHSTTYFEIEVNPLGTTFDARIESPQGIRSSMRTDLAWTCEGLFAAVRRTDDLVETMVRIPFRSVATANPSKGDRWRANFFRVDRSASHGDEYSAWRATLKTPPDFHVVGVFGTLLFV